MTLLSKNDAAIISKVQYNLLNGNEPAQTDETLQALQRMREKFQKYANESNCTTVQLVCSLVVVEIDHILTTTNL